MVMGLSEVEKLSGVGQQLTPEEEQIADGEPQTITQSPMPLVEIAQPDQRMEPLPVTAYPAAEAVAAAGVGAAPLIIGQPILVLNRFSGGNVEWQELVRWDIPMGVLGDLHEISLLSDDDAHTRYRLILANVDQGLPLDRAMPTPATWPWRDTKVPGGTSVYVQVRSTDGTVIQVDGSITGTVRLV